MKRKTEEKRSPAVRCAIYTRKSTEEGLEQEFNSLDAQRESAEAYVASQKHEGWIFLPDRYDDGGFTGGNMDRPALQRLLRDIEDGKVDCIVVYKVDRLSRSLIDFSKIMDVLERHSVSFVSVTQQFNTGTSMGRLMLNVLLSFAQFEREIISERTRDKIAAARRKGKWVGGRPILGFDLASNGSGGRVVVNEDEATQVRQIFETYLRQRSLISTLRDVDRRGIRAKEWTTRRGETCGGKRFTKESLYRLLTNIAYIGKVRYHDQVYEGEHPAIVSETLWHRVQDVLRHNGRNGGTGSYSTRNKYGALLKGLLRCGPCGCGMMHTYTSKANRRYRYYVCVNAQKRGRENCPTKSVPAAEIERFVVDRIKAIGKDDEVLARTLEQARKQNQDGLEELQAERRRLERELAKHGAEVRKLIDHVGAPGESPAAARLADMQGRIRATEQRATEVREQIVAVNSRVVDENELARALSMFDPVWDSLSPSEQARVLHLLAERITYDGGEGTLAITFRPTGIKALTEEWEAVAC
ncbi:MAG: recombinase family protein [Phycisphaerae bacterium]|nr:recombinase family protein [Phycisphaerae bacterium]